MPENFYNFAKLHSGGNSCVVVLDLDARYEKWQEIAPAILHGHRGVGADQFLVVRESLGAHFEILGFDPDGSLVGMCGNGLRCTAAVLQHWRELGEDQQVVELALEERTVRVRFSSPPSADLWKGVQVNFGKPVFEAAKIPLAVEANEGCISLELGGKVWKVRPLSVGNPHGVVFVDELDLAEVSAVGSQLEKHEAFPEGTSAEFVQVLSSSELRVGIWERSTGLASACASGTAAALVASVEAGHCDGQDTLIHLPGGDFFGSYNKSLGEVSISGDVVLIAEGTLRPRGFERELSGVLRSIKGFRRSDLTTQ